MNMHQKETHQLNHYPKFLRHCEEWRMNDEAISSITYLWRVCRAPTSLATKKSPRKRISQILFHNRNLSMPSLRYSGIRLITYQSEVATGRIARFTLTRLCCSQTLLNQDLFPIPHVSKELRHQCFHIGAYAPSPVYCCLDFPQHTIRCIVAVLLPRTSNYTIKLL